VGFIIANDYVTMMNVESVLLLAGKLVNLGTCCITTQQQQKSRNS
jgi:hypothetical protein